MLLAACPLVRPRRPTDYQLQGYVDLDMKYMGRLPFRSKGQVNADQLRQLPGIPAAAGIPGHDFGSPGRTGSTACSARLKPPSG